MLRFAWLLLVLIVACGDDPVDSPKTPDAGTVLGDAGTVSDAGTSASDAGSRDAAIDTDGGIDADAGSSADAGAIGTITLGGMRPAPMHVPADYDGSARPLVVLLHGYTVTGAIQDTYFGMSARVDEDGHFLIVPTGTRETMGQQSTFWNATPACCNFFGSTVDDVGYLDGLIAEAMTQVNVDPQRIYFVGHSNGGFMAYRMACESATPLAGIVSLAGATFFDPTNCVDPEPIHVLQIHGTNDGTIAYNGVATGPMRYPGAVETVTRWATRAGCDTNDFQAGTNVDVEAAIAGAETTVQTFRTGCTSGLEVELWTIENGPHIPNLDPDILEPDFAELVADWIAAHPRP